MHSNEIFFVSDSRDREQESQATPDLEVIEVPPQLNFEDMGPMGGAGYEPSADELIDVLKNLENLAAVNPGLYRTIVEQIQGKCHQIKGTFFHW